MLSHGVYVVAQLVAWFFFWNLYPPWLETTECVLQCFPSLLVTEIICIVLFFGYSSLLFLGPFFFGFLLRNFCIFRRFSLQNSFFSLQNQFSLFVLRKYSNFRRFSLHKSSVWYSYCWLLFIALFHGILFFGVFLQTSFNFHWFSLQNTFLGWEFDFFYVDFFTDWDSRE